MPLDITRKRNKQGDTTLSGSAFRERPAIAPPMFEKPLSDGLIAIDSQDCITLFNHGAELLLGYAQREVIGQPISSVLRSRVVMPEEFSLPQVGSTALYELLDKQGHPIPLYLSHALDFPEAQLPSQSILLLRAISEFEATNNLKLIFLESISQEFRTPLAAIKASVEFFIEELEMLSTAEVNALLSSIHLSVSGLETMIDNILESMNIKANRFRLQLQMVDLAQVIQAAVQSTKPMLTRRQQNLDVQIRDSLPLLALDPNRLEQAIVNLLSNASKFSPIGQPIDLQARSGDGRSVRVSVADRGPGIPAAERAELFRPFGRLGKPDEPPYGIGLGLSLVKVIVEAHGGEVGIDDREGGGSVVWFNLPYNTV